MIIASDRRQARTIFRYCRALLTGPSTLRRLVGRESADGIELTNGVVVEIHTASYSAVRGYTVVALLLDELAFFPTDSEAADPDEEVINAARPAMATIPNAMMLVASSPYARRGALWNAYRRYWGDDSGPLVWRAATKLMNPTVSQEFIDEQYERDPQSAAAEYGAEFRTDIEAFVAREVVEALVVPGRHELPPLAGTIYNAFVDPSGGSADSMTLAIGHFEGAGHDHCVLDLVREVRPPFSPESVVSEFARTLRDYHVFTVTGDRYGGEWPAERFREHGIRYAVAEKPKSDLYREFLPLLNSNRIGLLDHPRLIAQLCGLERRTARGGRDSIDHPPGGHDDIANVVAGMARRPLSGVIVTAEMVMSASMPVHRRRW